MNPFRFDVLTVTGLLALPVVGSGLSGEMTADQGIARFLACWVVATIGVGILTSQLEAAREEQRRIRAELEALIAASNENENENDEPAETASAQDGPRDPWASDGQNNAGSSEPSAT